MSIYFEIAKEAAFGYDTETGEDAPAYLELKGVELKENTPDEVKDKLKKSIGKTINAKPEYLRFISETEYFENTSEEEIEVTNRHV